MKAKIEPVGTSDLTAALRRLYGERASAVAAEVALLAANHRAPSRTLSDGPGWSEEDVWLITYPDQFQKAGEPPLATLRRTFDAWMRPALNGVHILPCYPWTSDDGYAITDYLNIEPSYGSWSDIEAIAEGARLMLDAVVNHMSASSGWFRAFLAGDPEYAGYFRTADPHTDLSATVRPRTTSLLTRFDSADGPAWVWTTFSADQVDLDYRSPEVFLAVVRVLYEYAHHGAQMIRLDAVQFIGKDEGTSSINLPQAHDVVRGLRAALDVAYPTVFVLTESNVPHEENLAYLGGPDEREAQIVYQFPLAPLVLHTMMTGDATTLMSWIGGLAQPRPGTSYLNFLASHDGVGVRPVEGILTSEDVEALVRHTELAGGMVNARALPEGGTAPYELASTWFDLMAHGFSESDAIDRHLASHAIMFALQGIPAVYVHSLFGTSNDHHLADSTGMARSLNRHKFGDESALEMQLSDTGTRASRVLQAMTAMLEKRRGMDAFAPDEPQRMLFTDPRVFAIERGGRARVYVNVSSTAIVLEAPPGWTTVEGDRIHQLDPWQAAWLTRSDG